MTEKSESCPEIWNVWSLGDLSTRLVGPAFALRELKRRGEAGALLGWSIYKEYVRHLIRTCFLPQQSQSASFRSPLVDDLKAVDEDWLVEEIEDLHWRYPDAEVPVMIWMDLLDNWTMKFHRRIRVSFLESPNYLTKAQIDESKRLTRMLYAV